MKLSFFFQFQFSHILVIFVFAPDVLWTKNSR